MDQPTAYMLFGATVACLAVAIGILAARLYEDLKVRREAKEPQESQQAPARPRQLLIDKPPHYATHIHSGGDPVTTCTCHDRPIADGDRILVWPTEELLCEETYSQEGYKL